MIVIAHRGASAELPENTLAAFERAVERGADMIELDLRATRDGVAFAAHDPVPAAPGGRRRPLAWDEVAARAGADARYPRLEAILDALAGRIPLNLELKERAAVEPVARELVRRGLGDGILVSSFDPAMTRGVRELAPRVAAGLLVRRIPLRLDRALARLGAASLHVPADRVTRRAIGLAHALGARVLVYTVDDPAAIRRLGEAGADGVFTNDPAGARRALGADPADSPSGAGHTAGRG